MPLTPGKQRGGTSREGIEIMRRQGVSHAGEMPGMPAPDAARQVRLLRIRTRPQAAERVPGRPRRRAVARTRQRGAEEEEKGSSWAIARKPSATC